MDMPASLMSAPGVSMNSADTKDMQTLRAKAVELEGVFLNTLVSQMMDTIDTDGEFGGGYAEETWRSMQSEQIADEIARAGGIGLADQIVDQMLTKQNAAYAAQLVNSNGK